MPKLFGIDIAKEVSQAFNNGRDLLPATLIKVTSGDRTTGSLTGGTNPTERKFSCRGIRSAIDRNRIDETLVQNATDSVLLLAATLPSSIVPATDDKIIIEGQTFFVVNVMIDPASATYTCLSRA